MGIVQKLRHVIKEQKEAHKAFKEAKKAEQLRTQHLSQQKKLELRKQRLEKAKESGVRAAHKTETIKKELKTLKEKSSPIIKSLLAKSFELAEKHTRPTRSRPKARRSRKRRHKRM